MELRSFNVERIYLETTQGCPMDGPAFSETLAERKEEIKDMLSQVHTDESGSNELWLCNTRKDGEVWTPYLQIVRMLINMGHALGLVSYEGALEATTKVKIL